MYFINLFSVYYCNDFLHFNYDFYNSCLACNRAPDTQLDIFMTFSRIPEVRGSI